MILFNTCSRPRARRGQDLQRPRPARSTRKRARPSKVDRRARLHGPEGPGADLPAAPRTSTSSSAPGSSRRCRELIDAGRRQPAQPQLAVSLGRTRRRRATRSSAASRATTRCATRRCGRRRSRRSCGSDRLRQVLHLLHRPHDARPRAEPAAPRTSSPKCRQLADEGLQGNHAARPDGQQLQASPRTAGLYRLSDLLDALHDIAGHRADQVRHELPQAT